MPGRISLPLPIRIFLLLALAFLAPAAGARAQGISAAQQPTMPDVVGLTREQAITRLQRLQMSVRVRDVASAQPRGVVVTQEPTAGHAVKIGSAAVLEVSTGARQPTTDGQGNPDGGTVTQVPSEVTVPDLTGMSVLMARARLVTAGLVPGRVDSASAEGARPGRVVAQQPAAGTVVGTGTRVRMTIARRAPAPAPPAPPAEPRDDRVTVPSVAGKTVAEARAAIGAARLLLGGVDSASSSAAAGTVVGQNPAAGERVDPGTFVTVTVARPRLVRVPSLAGQPLARARQTLADAGLRAGKVTEREAAGDPRVVGQSVAAGTAVAPNTAVDLTVSRAPAVAAPPVQPVDTPAATQPVAPPAARDTSRAPEPAAAPPPALTQPAAPAADRPSATTPREAAPAPGRFPRAAVWAIGVLLVLVVLGLVLRRFRGRPPARREAVEVAPVPVGPVPVGVRVRVDGGEQAAAPGPEKVTTGGRVRLGVRLADPRPKEGNLAQVPLGVGRVAVRMAEGEVPRPTEQPETVLAGRARVTMSDDQPEFWPGDGGSVILKRR